MVRADKGNLIGSWAFLIGVILAVILGLFSGATGDGIGNTMIIILVILGLIVGFFNVADEEVSPFLLSGAVLIIAASLGGQLMTDIKFVNGILEALLAIFVPATIIVAIKNVFSIARR
ncbi:hypothetical protein J4461_01695 [Candidatus Pacearchaeota archaeon]|nr:hypothetical protein [Candidatus Pacearchaeota archaeon]